MVKIGNKMVGDGHPCYIVAEIGINHNGSLAIAMKLIDAALAAGCDAVKFQKREVNIVYSKAERDQPRVIDPSIIKNALDRLEIEGKSNFVLPDSTIERLEKDPNNTTNGDLKYALEFGLKEYDLIGKYCQEKRIHWFASCWDGLSAHFLNGFKVPCHKIASPCLTHEDLLKRVRSNGKPVILSTGGSTLEQIERAVEILGREDLVILACTSSYPAQDHEINLEFIETLKRLFPGVPIGYSGHEADYLPSIAAVIKGACVVERHITLDKNMPGSDHKVSLDPNEFKEMVDAVRRVEKMRGNVIKPVLEPEKAIMKKLRRIKDF